MKSNENSLKRKDISPHSEFISTEFASRATGYTRDYVSQLCREGKLVCKREGRAWVISRVSLQSYLSNAKEAKQERGYHAVANDHPHVAEKLSSKDDRLQTVQPTPRYEYEVDAPLLPQSGALRKKDLFDRSTVVAHKVSSLQGTSQSLTPATTYASVFLQKGLPFLFIGLFLFASIASGLYKESNPDATIPGIATIEGIAGVVTERLDEISFQATALVQNTPDTLQDTTDALINGEITPLEAGLTVASPLEGVAKGFFEAVQKSMRGVGTLVQNLLGKEAPSSQTELALLSDEERVLIREKLRRTRTEDSSPPPSIPNGETGFTPPVVIESTPQVIERVVEREVVSTTEGLSEAELEERLSALNNKLQSQIFELAGTASVNSTSIVNNYTTISRSNKIDDLGNVTIHDSNITDSSFSGTSVGATRASFDTLTVDTSFTAPSATFTGTTEISGDLNISHFTATSTTATSSIAGPAVLTHVPTNAHTFSAWSLTATGTNALDASLVVNPASAGSDRNLVTVSVAGVAKFIVDAEGDIFAGSLTTTGGNTLSTTTASDFTVENNTTLGDATTDTLTVNARIDSDLIPSASNTYYVGTSTHPWKQGVFGTSVAIGGTATTTGTALTSSGRFDIDTTGVFSINATSSQNVGIGTSTPGYALEVTSGDIRVTGLIDASRVIATSTSATSTFAGGLAVETSGFVYDYSTNNVGIGTASPTEELTVYGSGDVQFLVGSGSGTDFNIGRINATGALQIQGNQVGANNIVLAPTSGNVGIGTTSPLARLSVTGAGATSATYSFISTDSNDVPIFAVRNDGKVGVATTSALTAIPSLGGVFNILSQTGNASGLVISDNTSATLRLGSVASGVFGFSSDVSQNLAFRPGGSELVRITTTDVGIGVIDPDTRLEVFETVSGAQLKVSYDATRYANFQVDSAGDLVIDAQGGDVRLNDENLYVCAGGSCPSGTPSGTGNLIVETELGVGSSSPAEQLGVANNLFVAGGGTPTLGTATSTFQGDIIIRGKLDVGTIDPVYTIDGTKYATYGHSTIGIKEETVLKVALSKRNEETGLYEHEIDFSSLPEGTDLWLFYQITDFGDDWNSLVITLTPGFQGSVFYEEQPEENMLKLVGEKPGSVSVRLVANRFDASRWPNLRPDQDSGYAGHIIESKK